MLSFLLGLVAALGWGTHDLMVRRISPGARVGPQIASVMTVAALVVLPFGLAWGDASRLTLGAGLFAVGSGVAYFAASLCLYHAFARAPARLVAPVIGAYPLPALVFAAMAGVSLGASDWIASGLIVAGVGIVAIFGHEGGAAQRGALPLAVLACLGMATAFALGHQATEALDPYLAPTIARCASAATALGLLMLHPAGVRAALRQFPTLAAMGVLDGVALTAVLAAGALPMAIYASVVSSLFGMVTVLLAWAVLGEKVTLKQGAGIGLVFAGLGLLSL
ncbi:DMT family transporter [Stagnihabitans tardus]|uniref:EamA family transporter n=1 Tax=Stagnihabitans tardus TaxID=2699202 RepID=A0AAE4Y6V0_9RHOB|nr:DMT family transporter [Stagnihabitans tardus]NBZ86199.1 EamA family transporter [Stagnihabitans tardus]